MFFSILFTDINIFCVPGDLIWNPVCTSGLLSAGQMLKHRREIKIGLQKWLGIEKFV